MSMLPRPTPFQVAGRHYQLYDAYHYQLAKNREGYISAVDGVDFLKRSGLSDTVMTKIWAMCNPQGKDHLDKTGLFMCLKLITLAQTGKEVNMPNALQDIDATPEISGYNSITLNSLTSNTPLVDLANPVIEGMDMNQMVVTTAAPSAAPVSVSVQQPQPMSVSEPENQTQVVLFSRQAQINQQLRHQRQQQLQRERLILTETPVQHQQLQKVTIQQQETQPVQHQEFQKQQQTQQPVTILQHNFQQQQLPRQLVQQEQAPTGPSQQQQQSSTQAQQPQNRHQSQLDSEALAHIINQLHQQPRLFQNQLRGGQIIRIQFPQPNTTGTRGQMQSKPVFQLQMVPGQAPIQGPLQGIQIQQANSSQYRWVFRQQRPHQNQPRMLSQNGPIRFQIHTEQAQILRPQQLLIQTPQQEQRTSAQPQAQPQQAQAPVMKTYQQQTPRPPQVQLTRVPNPLKKQQILVQQEYQPNAQVQQQIPLIHQQQTAKKVPSLELWGNLMNQISHHSKLFENPPPKLDQTNRRVIQTQAERPISSEQVVTVEHTQTIPQVLQPSASGEISQVQFDRNLSLQQKITLQHRAQKHHSQTKTVMHQLGPGQNIIRPQLHVHAPRKQTYPQNQSQAKEPITLVERPAQQLQTGLTAIEDKFLQPQTSVLRQALERQITPMQNKPPQQQLTLIQQQMPHQLQILSQCVQRPAIKQPQAYVQRQTPKKSLTFVQGKTSNQSEKTVVRQNGAKQSQIPVQLEGSKHPQATQASSQQLVPVQQSEPQRLRNLHTRASRLVDATEKMSQEMRNKLIRERHLRAAENFTENPVVYQFLCAAVQSSLRIFRRMYNNFPFLYKRITPDSEKHYAEFKLFLSDDALNHGAELILNQWEADLSFSGELSKDVFKTLKEVPRYLKLIRKEKGDPEEGGAPYHFTEEEINGDA